MGHGFQYYLDTGLKLCCFEFMIQLNYLWKMEKKWVQQEATKQFMEMGLACYVCKMIFRGKNTLYNV